MNTIGLKCIVEYIRGELQCQIILIRWETPFGVPV